MTVLAIRTYEPWSVPMVLAGLALLAVTMVLLILAAQQDNE